MEQKLNRRKASVAPVAPVASAPTKIEWWNRPYVWAIGAVIVTLALVGVLSPDRTPASSSPQTAMSPATGTPTFTLRGETPAAEVKENSGTVNVQKGNALVDTNTGTINIGTINIGTPEKVTVVEEKVVEKIVEVPVERRVFVVVPDTRKPDDRCEMLGREHDQRVAEWKANPFGK
jgi:hypothetical protein